MFLLGIFWSAALALRVGISDRGARWVALLVASSPAVLACSMTDMPDVPTMTFAALGAERLLAFRDDRRVSSAIAATLGFALCVLSRPHGALVPVCLLPMLLPEWSLRALRSRAPWISAAPTAAAGLLVILVYRVMSDRQEVDTNIAGLAMTYANFSKVHLNLPNIPAQWVLSFPLGFAYAWLHGRRMVRAPWCWLGALIGVALAVWSQRAYHHDEWLIWQAPVTALGTAVLVDALVDAIARRDAIDVGLALWLLIAVPTALYSQLPPKYLVPSAPAMAVLIVRGAERQARTSWRALAALAAIGVALGVLVIRADAAMGEVGRTGGEIVAEEVKKAAPGQWVWADGAWGFQWYAMRAGAHPLSKAGRLPKLGDVVVVGEQGWVLQLSWKKQQRLRRLDFDEPGGRILTPPAGFFSNGWGPLPWVWSDEPLSPIEVWEFRD
jgi:hypothetical protein